MITSIRSLLFGSALLVAPQITSASLLLGISDFTTTQIPSVTGNYEAAGFTGDFSFTGSGSGIAPNGSNDGTWGPQPIAPTSPPANNGTSAANFGAGNGSLIVSLTAPIDQALGYLLFDAAAQSAGAILEITYTITPAPNSAGDLTTPSIALVAIGGGGFPAPNANFTDYMIDISSIVLEAGQTIAFTFALSGPSGFAYVDNIAITSIPEPGSMLGLGCVAGAGAFLRSRRRRA